MGPFETGDGAVRTMDGWSPCGNIDAPEQSIALQDQRKLWTALQDFMKVC